MYQTHVIELIASN